MVHRVAATRIDTSYCGMSVPIFYYISILSPSPMDEGGSGRDGKESEGEKEGE